MANAECIEQDSERAPSSQANVPEFAHLSVEPRLLNIGRAPVRTRYRPNFMPMTREQPLRAYPRLLLQGRWLEKAGFPCGSPVVVWVDKGCLMVEVVPENAESTSKAMAAHDSDPTLPRQPSNVPDEAAFNGIENDNDLEYAPGDAFNPSAQQNTGPISERFRRLKAKARRNVNRNPTFQQLIDLDEAEKNTYRFLGRREENVPFVSRALGAAIVAQREAVGMTAKKAYVQARLPAAQYYGIEGGSRQPSISVFLSICEAIAIHPRDLFNRVLHGMHYPDSTLAPEVIQGKRTSQRAPSGVNQQREKNSPPGRTSLLESSNPARGDHV